MNKKKSLSSSSAAVAIVVVIAIVLLLTMCGKSIPAESSAELLAASEAEPVNREIRFFT